MNWPLMQNNIMGGDLLDLTLWLEKWRGIHGIPKLTQGDQVAAFEREFADWLGCKYAVMVNSGASANLITMAALKERRGDNDEIIVPTITWSSDIMSVLHAGFKPVFVDINPHTLGMDFDQVFAKVGKYTKAVFVTHVLGFNALGQDTRDILKAHHVDLIEDCCEATGATMNGKKLGTFCLMSNFSFYYAHHMSTIEGGMVCTDSFPHYELLRRLRSHGLVREMSSSDGRIPWHEMHEDLDPQFIFAEPGYNVRSTEINAVIGRSQLKRLDENNQKRIDNLNCWIKELDESKFRVDYRLDGACNYALPLVLREPNSALMGEVIHLLVDEGIEYRRGTAGGGNQLRQPYLRRLGYKPGEYPQTEHVHFFGLYVGNYPDLQEEQIGELCLKLNAL